MKSMYCVCLLLVILSLGSIFAKKFGLEEAISHWNDLKKIKAYELELLSQLPSGLSATNPIGIFRHKITGYEYLLKAPKDFKAKGGCRTVKERAGAIIFKRYNHDIIPVEALPLTKDDKEYEEIFHLPNLVAIQPFVESQSLSSFDWTKATEDQMKSIFRQHVIDMFFGNHDGNKNNWLSCDGYFFPVDYGHALRGYVQNGVLYSPDDNGEIFLQPSYFSPKLVLMPVAKEILTFWQQKNTEIPDFVIEEIYKTVQSIENTSDQELDYFVDLLSQKEIKQILGENFYGDFIFQEDCLSSHEAFAKRRLREVREHYMSSWEKTINGLNSGDKHNKLSE